MSELNSGVNNSVAESEDFKPIPEEQWVQADTSSENQQVEVEESLEQENSAAFNFKALRSEIQDKKLKIEELEKQRNLDREYFERELNSLRSNYDQKPVKEDHFSEMDNDYIPSAGEIKSELSKLSSSMKMQMEELKMMQTYPDYQSVLQENLVPLLKEKPYLAQIIQNSPDRAQAAYDLAKMSKASKSYSEMSGPEKAQKIVENSRKAPSVSNYGGTSYIDKASMYEQMSDKDFMELAQRHLNQI